MLATRLAGWNPFRAPDTVESRNSPLVHKTKYAVVTLVTLFALIVAHPFSEGQPDGRLRIDFLDVGQGDSALVTMPDGTTLLVDAGGRPGFNQSRLIPDGDEPAFERDTRSVGEAVVSEYLWWRGLDSVDYILATHADADHIDGLNDVVRNFRVRAGLVGRAPAADPEFVRLATTAENNGVPLRLIGRGDVLRFGNVAMDVLWPPRTMVANAPSGNDDSIVLRLRFGNRTFLLTGDIEKGAEAAISGNVNDLHCDVAKVAHHGSRTSSTDAFVNAAKPEYAVISVGLTSMFGHPHKEVLDRWLKSGAEVFTTGKSGTITFSTDGNDLRVETFVKR